MLHHAAVIQGSCDWPLLASRLHPGAHVACLLRKPLEDATIASQVLETGTGALSLGRCRVSMDQDPAAKDPSLSRGRWPANVLLLHHLDCRAMGPLPVCHPECPASVLGA